MGSDTLAALGLGIERPAPDTMRRPPRPHDERLMNWPLALRAYLFLGLIEATAAMTVFFFVLNGAGWQYGQNLAVQDPLYLQATTACLSTIIIMQVINVFLCRSNVRSVFSTGFAGNALIITGVIVEIIILLVINYTTWLDTLLGTSPLEEYILGIAISFALGMLTFEEIRKWFARKMQMRDKTPGI